MNDIFSTSPKEIKEFVKGIQRHNIQHMIIVVLSIITFVVLYNSSSIINWINSTFKQSFTSIYCKFLLLFFCTIIIWIVDEFFINNYKKKYIPKNLRKDKKGKKEYKLYITYSAVHNQWINVLTIVSLLLAIITIDGIGIMGYLIISVIMLITFNTYLSTSQIALCKIKVIYEYEVRR